MAFFYFFILAFTLDLDHKWSFKVLICLQIEGPQKSEKTKQNKLMRRSCLESVGLFVGE